MANSPAGIEINRMPSFVEIWVTISTGVGVGIGDIARVGVMLGVTVGVLVGTRVGSAGSGAWVGIGRMGMLVGC